MADDRAQHHRTSTRWQHYAVWDGNCSLHLHRRDGGRELIRWVHHRGREREVHVIMGQAWSLRMTGRSIMREGGSIKVVLVVGVGEV